MDNKSIFENRKQFFFNNSSTTKGGIVFCILIGIISFLMGMLAKEHVRVWGSLLFNLSFFFSLAVGGVAFGHMQDLIGAQWARPIKRIHESFAAFIPYSVCLYLLFFIAIRLEFLDAHRVYSWIANPHLLDHFHGKNVWLQKDFMIVRDVVCLFIILFLRGWQLDKTTSRDFIYIEGSEQQASAEAELSQKSLRYWSAPILVVYAVCYSIIAFDTTMSLAPTWFSTLWAGWLFSIMMQTLMATLLLAMFLVRKSVLGEYIGRQQFHDVGKLFHGFTVFFAYLTYAHILTYWYTNIPEETSWFLLRLKSPWLELIIISPFLTFLLPFIVLIFKASKWTPLVIVPLSIIVILAQVMSYYLVVMPEILSLEQWYVPWIELGVFIGFLGIFIASILKFAAKYPMLSIADPILPEALRSGH
jgi:hypothetical protein